MNERFEKDMTEQERIHNKWMFVKALGEFVEKWSREKVESMELVDKDTVAVHYTNGYTKTVNIACDSYLAIMMDVSKEITY